MNLRRASAGILCLALLAAIAPAIACCSLQPAHFSDTTGYAGEGYLKGRVVHVIGYQNRAQNLAMSGGKPKGNALFLPIPAVAGTMTQENIVDTSAMKNVLEDMARAIPRPRTRSLDRGIQLKSFGMSNAVVFEHDIYTIVLAKSAKDIQTALSRVPAAKRPDMNPEIFAAYDKWYPGWTFALCCFNTAEADKAAPMVWWYQPQNPNRLFFPALDAHDGHAPNLTATVDVDHTIAVGSTHRSFGEFPVFYRDTIPTQFAKLFPAKIYGERYEHRSMPNGDFVFDLTRGGKLARAFPPGAGIASAK